MKIDQYCQRQRCKHVKLEQFWRDFASRGFASDSWAFLFLVVGRQRVKNYMPNITDQKQESPAIANKPARRWASEG